MKSIFDMYLKALNEAEETFGLIDRTKRGQFAKGRGKSDVFGNTENMIPDDFAKMMGKYWVAIKLADDRKCYLEFKPEKKTVFIYGVPYEDSSILCLVNEELEWYDKKSGKRIPPPQKIELKKNTNTAGDKNNWFYINNIKVKNGSTKGISVQEPGISSLKGCPTELYGNLYCAGIPSLASLEGSPKKVMGFMNVSESNLTNLEGMPEYVGRYFNCTNSGLKSLSGANKSNVIVSFDCNYNDGLDVDFIPRTAKFICNSKNLDVLKKKYKFGESFEPSTEDNRWPDNLVLIPFLGSDKANVEKHLRDIRSLYNVSKLAGKDKRLENVDAYSEERNELLNDIMRDLDKQIEEMILSRPNFRLRPIWEKSYSSKPENQKYAGYRNDFTSPKDMNARYFRTDGSVFSFRISAEGKSKDQGVSDEELTKGFDVLVETNVEMEKLKLPDDEIEIDFSALDSYNPDAISNRGISQPDKENLLDKNMPPAKIQDIPDINV